MFDDKKCYFGYHKKHMKKEIILTAVLFAVSLGLFFGGIYLNGGKKNLLTVIAVLGLLPAGKELVGVIMSIKAVKFACSDKLYKAIKKATDASAIEVRYDLYMTTYDAFYPIYSLTVIDDCILGYTDVAFDADKFEKHITKMLSQNGYKISNIKIFDKEAKYTERLKSWCDQDNKQTDKELLVLRLMENLSL